MTFTVDIDENCKRFVQMKLSSRTLKERCIEEDRVRKKIRLNSRLHSALLYLTFLQYQQTLHSLHSNFSWQITPQNGCYLFPKKLKNNFWFRQNHQFTMISTYLGISEGSEICPRRI